MGQPIGEKVKETEERNRVKDRVKGTTTYIIAQEIGRYLDTHGERDLQNEFELTYIEAAQVLAELKERQRKIDPDGDWR